MKFSIITRTSLFESYYFPKEGYSLYILRPTVFCYPVFNIKSRMKEKRKKEKERKKDETVHTYTHIHMYTF